VLADAREALRLAAAALHEQRFKVRMHRVFSRPFSTNL
jgi:hypothetical protein